MLDPDTKSTCFRTLSGVICRLFVPDCVDRSLQYPLCFLKTDNYCDSDWLSNRGECRDKPCNLFVLRTVSELSVCSGHVRVVERSVRNRKRAVRQHGRDFWTLGSQLQLSPRGFSIYVLTGLVRSQTRFKPQRHTSQKQVRMATHFTDGRRCLSFQMYAKLT